ncbi:MAG: alkaline phosphatase [Flavobacteriaceae bacterium]|nr:alkaline phosphatase [Flavobacteriaceae bacterium]MDG1962523.1 alkaline phosphatase [Flavobacteriaceae bacterium]
MRYFLTLFFCTLLTSCHQSSQSIAISSKKNFHSDTTTRPKNIILVIGDGTGLSQISSLEFYKNGQVHYERFPVIGLSKVSSTSRITDSGAAATALACGEKTFNRAIGVDSLGQSIPNIIEFAHTKNMATGVIATSSITHATPASFYAHDESRYHHEMIAKALTQSEVTYFAGSGLQYFNQRSDQNNLLDTLVKKGYTLDTTSLSSYPDAQKLGYLIGATELPKISESRGDFLVQASSLGLRLLEQSDNGFFLMTEGSQVDWGGHDNDFNYMVAELIDLDDTIGTLLDYAIADQETLLIVTGDHATGGLVLAAKDGDYNVIEPKFSTGNHTGDWIPVFAYGPGAQNFAGVYENTEIYHKMIHLLGTEEATEN